MSSSLYVSVIVPVYNAEATLAECISSLLNLDYPTEKLEYIFVDNASTDRTAEILKSHSQDQRIRVLYEPKRGPAAARNKGLRNARGEVVALTDSDCIVDRNWLTNIIAPLEDPTVGVVGGKILATPGANEIEKFGEDIHDHDKAINLYQPPYVITMNWASRLAVLKQSNLFDEDLIRGEDVDLSQRILLSGYKLVYNDKAIVYHRNETSLSGLFHEGFAHGFYSVQVLKKHRELVEAHGYTRVNKQSYVDLWASFRRYVVGDDSQRSICYFSFNLGKKAGKVLGSLRFLSVDL